VPPHPYRFRRELDGAVADAGKVKKLSRSSQLLVGRVWHSTSGGRRHKLHEGVIVDAKNGVKLELIFHPLAGLDSYPIRKDFIVALVSAAKRLGLPVVPKELITTSSLRLRVGRPALHRRSSTTTCFRRCLICSRETQGVLEVRNSRRICTAHVHQHSHNIPSKHGGRCAVICYAFLGFSLLR
jgi:hypothetical protein